MTVNQLYREIIQRLDKSEALAILEFVCNITRSDIVLNGDRELPAEVCDKIFEICDKRTVNIPLQYLIGKWSFWGADFTVGEGVLIPRDDTEVVVSACIDYLSALNPKKADNIRIIDLCSGSGIIAVTLANMFKRADVTALEKSDKAFEYLTQNIELNNSKVSAFKGDIFYDYDRFEDNYFDLIVSNPPYIRSGDIKTLQREVQFEPLMALDGGEDGYVFYRSIISNWSAKLKSGGMIAFELGEGQSEFVSTLMLQNGFENIKTFKDLSNIDRAIVAIKK